MDKTTGILWANLDYFPYKKEHDYCYTLDEAKSLVNNYSIDGIDDWQIPTFEVFKQMIYDKTFPFKQGDNWRIKWNFSWFCYINNSSNNKINLDNFNTTSGISWILPCNYSLIQDSEYEKNISEDNNIYTEKERLQFTLDLFRENELLPIFKNNEITDLYKKIYFII